MARALARSPRRSTRQDWSLATPTTLTGNAHAFLYDGRSLKDLGGLGGDISKAAALNGVGQVAGYALTKKGRTARILLDRGGRIGRLQHAHSARAVQPAVSDSGSIVAYSHAGLVLLKVH